MVGSTAFRRVCVFLLLFFSGTYSYPQAPPGYVPDFYPECSISAIYLDENLKLLATGAQQHRQGQFDDAEDFLGENESAGFVRIWDLRTGHQFCVAHEKDVELIEHIAISPDGLWMASCNVITQFFDNRSVSLWAIPPLGTPDRYERGEVNPTERVNKWKDKAGVPIFSRDSKTLFIAGPDGIWTCPVEEAQDLKRLVPYGTDQAVRPALSPDGSEIYIATDLKPRGVGIAAIHTTTGEVRQVFRALPPDKNKNDPYGVRAMAVSDDGRFLAGVLTHSTVVLWDCKTAQELRRYHAQWAKHAVFLNNQELAIVGG